jgi:hypothetical protein
MPVRDTCEPEVIEAFVKQLWRVTVSYAIRGPQHVVLADLHLSKAGQTRIIEVKCFSKPDKDLDNFYSTLGQYQYYQQALILSGEDAPLYLALPAKAYTRLSQDEAMRNLLQTLAIRCVIIDLNKREVLKWIG